MTECAKLRLENELLRTALNNTAMRLAEEKAMNHQLRKDIDKAIDKLEEMQRKRLIIEVKYGGQ